MNWSCGMYKCLFQITIIKHNYGSCSWSGCPPNERFWSFRIFRVHLTKRSFNPSCIRSETNSKVDSHRFRFNWSMEIHDLKNSSWFETFSNGWRHFFSKQFFSKQSLFDEIPFAKRKLVVLDETYHKIATYLDNAKKPASNCIRILMKCDVWTFTVLLLIKTNFKWICLYSCSTFPNRSNDSIAKSITCSDVQ